MASENRKNLHFRSNDEEQLAYDFLCLLGGRVQAPFVAKLIHNHLINNGITSLNGLTQERAREIAQSFPDEYSRKGALEQLIAFMIERGLYIAPMNPAVSSPQTVLPSPAAPKVEDSQNETVKKKATPKQEPLVMIDAPDDNEDDEELEDLTTSDAGILDELQAFI